MSVLYRFSPVNLTSEQYDGIKQQLSDGGHWPPDGLEYHVCFGTDGDLKVSEIWSSDEQFEAFGQNLMPILEAAGAEQAGPPERLEIYKQERF